MAAWRSRRSSGAFPFPESPPPGSILDYARGQHGVEKSALAVTPARKIRCKVLKRLETGSERADRLSCTVTATAAGLGVAPGGSRILNAAPPRQRWSARR